MSNFKATIDDFARDVKARLRPGDKFAIRYNGAEEMPWTAEVYAGQSGRIVKRGTLSQAMGDLFEELTPEAPTRCGVGR